MRRAIEAIVIGGSAGALEALYELLPALPSNYALPVVIVVHIPPNKHSYVSEVLRNYCALAIKEAEDKEDLAAGVVYVAPPDYHLLVEQRRCLSLSADDPVLYSRPSIDVLFETAADAFGAALAGVLLSGGNEDGARGLSRIRGAGGLSLVQDPHTAVARAMPASALALGPVDRTLPPSDLGKFLARLGERPLELTEAG